MSPELINALRDLGSVAIVSGAVVYTLLKLPLATLFGRDPVKQLGQEYAGMHRVQQLAFESLLRQFSDHKRETERAIEESEYRMGRTRQEMEDARKDFATQIAAAQEERNKLVMSGGKH